MALSPTSSRGTVRAVNLGTTTVAGLITAGATTIYTPTAGDFVALQVLRHSYDLAQLGAEFYLAIGSADADTLDVHSGADPGYYTTSAYLTGDSSAGTALGYIRDGSPIQARIATPATNIAQTVTSPKAWQANHSYTPDTDYVVATAHLWVPLANGTSGGTIPNFAAHLGGTVADNDLTWEDIGALPTAGSFRILAFAYTP